MKNTNFIKENFINILASPVTSIEEATNSLKDELEKASNEPASKGIYYNFINRNEYLKEAFEALNDNSQKLFFISGFQGTGKTEFINTIISALEENVLNFYYECSPIANLDDIILSLFNYIKKISIKAPEYKRAFKISESQSIDERLMNYIKSLNRPLLIVIDGFENLIQQVTEEKEELIHFLEFLSSLPEIKLIVSGRKVNSSDFKKQKNIFEIKLGGLEDQQAYKLLKDNGIQETESGLQQIYQITRGYPENLLWFSNSIKALEVSSFGLMQEYYSQNQKSFEEFIYQKLFEFIPEEFFKTICFFASVRHSLTIETLKKLNFISSDASECSQEKINYLCSKMILTQNREAFYIKSLLKNTIYSNISTDQKKQIHKYLYELYSEQISKKLEERALLISRKLLYSEQYYHYMCLLNLGDKSLADLKTTTISNLKPDFKYLYANISDSLFAGNKESSSQSAEIIEFEEEKKETLYTRTNVPDLNVELSEEEKALLADENSPDDNLSLSSIELDTASELENLNLINSKIPDLGQVQNETKTATKLEEKAENLKTEANSFFEEKKFAKSIEKFKESLILYENLNDKKNINSVLMSLAHACNEGFRHDVALMYYHRVLNSEDATMDAEFKIESLCGIGDIYDYREDYENALNFYQEAFEEAEKYNNIIQKANICFKKALTYDDLGDFDQALEFYLKNTEIAENIEINPNIAAAYANIAAIYEEKEDLNKAKEYYLKSLKYDEFINNKEGQYETLSNIGNICFELSDCQNASNYFHQALEIAKKLDDKYKIAMSCLDIGDIHLEQKNYEKALKAFIIARKTIEKTISTDSKEKIDRRFKKVVNEVGEHNFKQIIEKLKKKHE